MIGNWNDSDTQRIIDSFDGMPTMREVIGRIEGEPFCVQWKDEDGESFDYMGFVNETSERVYSALWDKFR